MASSAPPVLPVSFTPQTTAAGSSVSGTVPAVVSTSTSTAQSQAPPPVPPPALRSFIANLASQARDGFGQRRPWGELIDRSAFSKPDSLSEATQRVRKNYPYFRVNYLGIIGGVLALSLVFHPGSLLILMGLLSAWIFLYLFRPTDQPVLLFGRSFSERETLGMLVVLSVFVIFLTNVGSVLISAALIGVAIVCAHGSFRVPEDLFLDDQDQAPTGFLSFLGGAAKNAVAVAASPSVVGSSRV